METKTLTFEQVIKSTPAAVYRAFTHQNALTQWLSNDARLSAQEGGRLYLYWQDGYYACGEFKTVEPQKKLVFTWDGKGEQAVSTVYVKFSEVDEGTQVMLKHKEIATDDAAEIEKGWQESLAALQMMLEVGVDKRVADRPFLGVLIGGFMDDKQLAKLNIPEKSGVQIGGTMQGTGAAEAGFQDQDILVRMNGVDVTAYSSLGSALQGKKAGDAVSIDFYRAGEQQTTMMTLGSRPVPNHPGSPADFAEALSGVYAELDAQLDELFVGVSEKAAATRPADGEWSAKEVIAHLIVTERTQQIAMGIQVSNNAAGGYPGNDDPLLQSILTVYPTIDSLVAAWKQTEAETVALVANLPESFTSRTIDYLGLGMNLLLGLPGHTRGHYAQIREAITTVQEMQPVAA